jgi:hypothetical protein
MDDIPNNLDGFFDPLRGRLVRFPAHWPASARRLFLNQLGRFLAEQATKRAPLERSESETPPP